MLLFIVCIQQNVQSITKLMHGEASRYVWSYTVLINNHLLCLQYVSCGDQNRVCVLCSCEWASTVNLLVVNLVIYQSFLMQQPWLRLCGGNQKGSTSECPFIGLQANKRVTHANTSYYSCTHFIKFSALRRQISGSQPLAHLASSYHMDHLVKILKL